MIKLRDLIENIDKGKALEEEVSINEISKISEALETSYIDIYSKSYREGNKEYKELMDRIESFYLERYYINNSWGYKKVFFLDNTFSLLSRCYGDHNENYYYFVKEQIRPLKEFLNQIDNLDEEKFTRLNYIDLDQKLEDYYRVERGILSDRGIYKGDEIEIIPRHKHRENIKWDEELIKYPDGSTHIVKSIEIFIPYFS